MKLMSRDFTWKEKAVLVVLVVIILSFVYYLAVDRPCRRSMASAKAEKAELELELDAIDNKIAKLEGMEAEIAAIEASGDTSYMASYNNVKEERRELNDILADAEEYTINFSDVTRDSDTIRRGISIRFKTYDYETARGIIEALHESQYRNLITTVDYENNYTFRVTGTGNYEDSYITTTVQMTFYETMVGGTSDAGLPVTEEEEIVLTDEE